MQRGSYHVQRGSLAILPSHISVHHEGCIPKACTGGGRLRGFAEHAAPLDRIDCTQLANTRVLCAPAQMGGWLCFQAVLEHLHRKTHPFKRPFVRKQSRRNATVLALDCHARAQTWHPDIAAMQAAAEPLAIASVASEPP